MTQASGSALIRLTAARFALPLALVAMFSASLTPAYAADSGTSQGYSLSGLYQVDGPSLNAAAALATNYVLSTPTLSEPAMAPTFGGTLFTSPASTGHASPAGCCTWD